ncbi:MAG: guanylate kinase [Alphaproteobacteria bacterium]
MIQEQNSKSAQAPMNISRRGLMMVLSSPSGAGKTSLSRALLGADDNLSLSISVTTRQPRAGERDGVDYFFINRDEFHAMIEQDQLLEHAEVFGHHYGTPRANVLTSLKAGKDILFDIDWQGAQQLNDHANEDLVKIFILPPSIEALKQRLLNRALDSEAVVERRMNKADDEMSHYSEYDWVLVNVDFEQTLANIKAILHSERLRRYRMEGIGEFVKQLRANAHHYHKPSP